MRSRDNGRQRFGFLAPRTCPFCQRAPAASCRGTKQARRAEREAKRRIVWFFPLSQLVSLLERFGFSVMCQMIAMFLTTGQTTLTGKSLGGSGDVPLQKSLLEGRQAGTEAGRQAGTRQAGLYKA